MDDRPRCQKVVTVPVAAGSLRDLLTDVVLARDDLARQRRRTPVVQHELGDARRRLVVALRAYQLGLDADGAPMPYRLRDELRLLEALSVR
jgi:hypothetical protein